MTRFKGKIVGRKYVVTVNDGIERPLDPRLDLAFYSPSGFQWGCKGAGQNQLAVAIVGHILQIPPMKPGEPKYVGIGRLAWAVKVGFVQRLPHGGGWETDITRWDLMNMEDMVSPMGGYYRPSFGTL